MTKRKIRIWGYRLGRESVLNYCELPLDVNRDNLEESIQREWTYLEDSWSQTDWWVNKVLPKLRENRDTYQFEEAFDTFLKNCYEGFSEAMEELFEAERTGEKLNAVGMEH